MKKIIALLMLLPFLMLIGCVGQKTNNDIGPNTAWKDVSIEKMKAAAKIAEAEAKKAEAQAAEKPQMIIKSAEAMQEYASMQRDQAMLEIVKAQAETVKALTGNREPGLLDLPDQPKDPWAARLESAGKGIQSATSTSTSLVFATGKVVGDAAGNRYTATDGSSITGNGVDQDSNRDLVSYQNPANSATVNKYEEKTTEINTDVGNDSGMADPLVAE